MTSEVVADLADCIDAQRARHSSTSNYSARINSAIPVRRCQPNACGSHATDPLAALDKGGKVSCDEGT